MKNRIMPLFFLINSVCLIAQGRYTFRNETLPVLNLNAKSVSLNYPAYLSDISYTGMGEVQTAHGGRTMSQFSNPAFLAEKRNRFNIFSLQTSFPPSTWEAAWFLEENMDEFYEAISLNQVYDGVNAFLTPGATVQERWNALNEIHDGLEFVVNLMNEVTGPADDPQQHGFTVLPGIGAQVGNWGFSVYGYGQAHFMVRQSPTLDALAAVDIPENPDNLLQATLPVLQMMGIMGSGILRDNRTFTQEVFPVAFYLSTMDVVGAVGYGRAVSANINVGANVKIINRRFSLNRIPVVEYDQLIENAFSDLTRNKTGITLDLGAQITLPFGTEAGVALINTLPMQTLSDDISMDFIQHTISYDYNEADQKQVDANGDTLMVRNNRPVVLTLPVDLELPFILNIGFHHALTNQWSVGFDWLDVLENSNRYTSTTGRIRIGTQYQKSVWINKLSITGRLGFGDEHLCGGIGIVIYNTVFLDGAYAWDPLIETYAYYAQMSIEL